MAKDKKKQQEAARKHYQNNKEKIIKRASEFKKAARLKTRSYLEEIKKSGSCSICGIKDHRVLDFHHLTEKIANLGEVLNLGWSIKRIQKELEKCILVCSNCHRIIHYKN